MGAWHFLVLSAGKPLPIKFLVLGGGSANLFLDGRGDSSESWSCGTTYQLHRVRMLLVTALQQAAPWLYDPGLRLRLYVQLTSDYRWGRNHWCSEVFMCMCIEFVIQVLKQKNAHVSFLLGWYMTDRCNCSAELAGKAVQHSINYPPFFNYYVINSEQLL